MSGAALPPRPPTRSYSPIRKLGGTGKSDESPDAVKVVVRIRPMVGRELLQRCAPCVSQTHDPNQVLHHVFVGSVDCYDL
jgi:hypothetical protein